MFSSKKINVESFVLRYIILLSTWSSQILEERVWLAADWHFFFFSFLLLYIFLSFNSSFLLSSSSPFANCTRHFRPTLSFPTEEKEEEKKKEIHSHGPPTWMRKRNPIHFGVVHIDMDRPTDLSRWTSPLTHSRRGWTNSTVAWTVLGCNTVFATTLH